MSGIKAPSRIQQINQMIATLPQKPALDLGKDIRISPPIWPGKELEVQPGDLTQRAPYGERFYGFQEPGNGDPFKDAPANEACGGVIYFGNNITKSDFQALMRILEVQGQGVINPSKHFAVFTAESTEPGNDGYIAQMRLVSRFGLRFLYGAVAEDEYDQFPEQKVTMVEALWTFIESERERWGTSFEQDKEMGLAGLFGGNEDTEREELSFGFMLENEYNNICRIWSRAQLVTM